MFSRLGSFAVRFRWYIIAAWAVAAVAFTLFAPNIDDVSVTDQRAFLSRGVPSLQANELLKEYFPDQVALSSAVLVVDAGPQGDVTTGAAAGLVENLIADDAAGEAADGSADSAADGPANRAADGPADLELDAGRASSGVVDAPGVLWDRADLEVLASGRIADVWGPIFAVQRASMAHQLIGSLK